MKKIILIISLFAVTSFATDSTVIKELEAKANAGDSEAQYQLGIKYFYGKGVERDFFEAEEWLHLAAEQNHVRAQYELGLLYDPEWEAARGFEQRYRRFRYGEPITYNIEAFDTAIAYDTIRYYVNAEQWLLKAARAGLADAQYELVWFYQRGWGKNRGTDIQIYWLKKAAAQDYGYAQLELGTMYCWEAFGICDWTLAHFWLTLANDKDLNEATNWLKHARERISDEELNKANALVKLWYTTHPKK